MAKVVFEMIALVFEGVEALVFNFPTAIKATEMAIAGTDIIVNFNKINTARTNLAARQNGVSSCES